MLTANPWASSKLPNANTHPDRNPGWGVSDIDCAIAARAPGCPFEMPCQDPRPGQACSTAIPARNRPRLPRISRPSRGECQALSGSAISRPAAR